MTPTLTPAYGRDYKSLAELKKAIAENHEFVANLLGRSGYCCPSDFKGQEVSFRYNKLQKQVFIKI